MIIEARIHLNAKKDEITSFQEPNILNVSLRAAPIENKANIAVIELLSKRFHIAKTLISIKKGAHSRTKLIEIPDLTVLR
ncbi:MAG: DUF167 domain-containing protein [Patescibacteria group bacterium]|jgi:uncharacterized protein (TIGR00251 family)